MYAENAVYFFFMTINKGPDIWPFNTIVTVKM